MAEYLLCMKFIENIVSSKVIADPWQHQVIDNFFDHRAFTELRSFCEKNFSKYAITRNSTIDPINLIDLKKVMPSSLYQNLWDYNKLILKNSKDLLENFPDHRRHHNYYSMPSFHFMDKTAGEHPIHDETLDKCLSIVLYISPDVSHGTKIYSSPSKESFVNEIRWKPNRALLFCGRESTTWHSFGTGQHDRITLNFFLRKSDLSDATYYKHQDRIVITQNNKIIDILEINDTTEELIFLYKNNFLTI